MTPELPAPIHAYFAAKKNNNVEGMVASFSETATVRDEDKERRGLANIREWIVETNKKYRYDVEIRAATPKGNKTIVACRLTGDFPGSPVDVSYTFGLD